MILKKAEKGTRWEYEHFVFALSRGAAGARERREGAGRGGVQS